MTLQETKEMILSMIDKNFSDVPNVESFKSQVMEAEGTPRLEEIIELIEKAKVIKPVYEKTDDPWTNLLFRIQKDPEITEVFPYVKDIDPNDPAAREKLAGVMAISIDDNRHIFLDPKTLKYSYAVGSAQGAHVTLAQASTEYAEFYSAGIVHSYEHENAKGEIVEKKYNQTDMYSKHVRLAQKRILDLTAESGFAISRDKEKLVVRESGLELLDIKPTFHECCDQWLKLLSGSEYTNVVTWVAHSINFSRALPILSFVGSPNTGKSLLISAISKMFEHAEASITPDELFDSQFNGQIMSNPFVVADDGGLSVDWDTKEKYKDRLKQFITSNKWAVNPKFGKQTTLIGYLRCYCAFNQDKDHVRSLFDEKNPALGQRILHVNVPEINDKNLEQMFIDEDVYGEKSSENMWLGETGKLTQHLCWIINNKDKYALPALTGRWGNLTDYEYRGKLAANKDSQIILDFIKECIEEGGTNHTSIKEDIAQIRLNPFLEALKDYDKKGRYSRTQISDVLKALGGEYKRSRSGRWWELNIETAGLKD